MDEENNKNKKFYKFLITGTVQGVGFRPYIYKKAIEHGLIGSVKNIGHGVEIICNDKKFNERLDDAPPLATIQKISRLNLTEKEINEYLNYNEFIILKSDGMAQNKSQETTLPADIFMCEDCLSELNDQNNRRFSYYFITCTNCGPRFSMIKDYPYDRPTTAMDEFKMCKNCEKEYTNPLNRRYHAQTIACKDCGPKLKLKKKDNINNDLIDISKDNDRETIRKAMELVKNGEFISIKGVGGFHLCSLADDNTVSKVRSFLKRKNKPFAIMCKDLDMAKEIAYINPAEEKQLLSKERPIVTLKKKDDLYNEISELNSIGIILPYSALHYLMFDFIDKPLLMTSLNIPGEPVLTEEKLGDYFLTHERKIINRCDDSVIKVIDNKPTYLRRSRGFAPHPVSIGIKCKDTIALGAELNNAICSVKNNNAYLSQYIGEISKLKTFDFYKKTIEDFIHLTRSKPKIIACDLHPDYSSTNYAKELAKKNNAEVIQIQHHEAHIASVAAEFKMKECFGIAMDGLGLGRDDKLWGGEVFYFNEDEFNKNKMMKRIGHLEYQNQLGGDSATIQPRKMLYGILRKFMSKEEIENLNKKTNIYDATEISVLEKMMDMNFNTIKTSSTGRILDAVSSLLNMCQERDYDGRSAMLLEAKSNIIKLKKSGIKLKPIIEEQNGKLVLLTTPLFKFIIDNMDQPKEILAALAHDYLAYGMLEIIRQYKERNRFKDPIIKTVFSGGVVYNEIITKIMLNNDVLINKNIPAGDGGICVGQAYLANLIS